MYLRLLSGMFVWYVIGCYDTSHLTIITIVIVVAGLASCLQRVVMAPLFVVVLPATTMVITAAYLCAPMNTVQAYTVSVLAESEYGTFFCRHRPSHLHKQVIALHLGKTNGSTNPPFLSSFPSPANPHRISSHLSSVICQPDHVNCGTI